MDVTKDNFQSLFPLIQETINQADFIGFDTEFSGLNVGFEDKQHDYDTVEDRYQKLKHNCSRMNTFQVGLTAFIWNEEENQYLCRPFNFYVFKDSQLQENYVLQFQASCIKFLRENNFDFNKLFTEGISFQKLSKKEEIMRKCAEKYQEGPRFARFYTHLGKSSQELLAVFNTQADEFVQKVKNSQKNEQIVFSIESHALKRQLARDITAKYKDLGNIFTEFKKDNDQFIIKKWFRKNNNNSGYNRGGNFNKGGQTQAQQKQANPEEVKIDSASTGTTAINTQSTDISEESKKSDEPKLLDKQALVNNLYTQEMGFSLIVQELILSKKPIIGHNMIYDVVYLYNQFIDDLPDTYAEFIQKWNKLFPNIYDTKVLSSTSEYFGRTDLGKVYEKCTIDDKMKGNTKIVFDVAKGFTNYDGTGILSHYHEAAYDAYMTGYSFINILKFKEYDQRQFGSDGKPQRRQYQGGQQVKKEEEKKEEPQKADDTEIIQTLNSLQLDEENRYLKEGETTKPQKKVNYRVNLDHEFAVKYHNKVMLSQFSASLYHLDPERQEEKEKDYLSIAWVQVVDELQDLQADALALIFNDFGDFNIFKDSKTSFYIEFYYIEPKVVPSQNIEEFIFMVRQENEKLGIKAIVPYSEAVKFKAHNRIE